MIFYSIVMFVIGIVFVFVGIRIHQGDTKLIISYHQRRIREEDLPEYGKAFAKGIFLFALTFFVSGLTALFGKIVVSDVILFAGSVISIVVLYVVQRRYNKGLF